MASKIPRQIVVASRNTGKVAEIERLLSPHFQVFSLVDFPDAPADVAETGVTFEENAIIKATAYGQVTGILTVADDSGLEVTALDGRPGVYSKRYGYDDQHRNQKLLSELADHTDRSARFVCVVSLYSSQSTEVTTFTGICFGTIAHSEQGVHGFGYDPIFIPTGADGRTFSQMTQFEKNALSHRAKAFNKLTNYLRSI